MNFGEIIKNEILSKPIKERHCKKAFLAGVIRGSGVLYEREDGLGFDFNALGEKAAFLISDYFKTLFSFDIREITVEEDRLNRKDRYIISLSGARTDEILAELGVLTREGEGYSVNFDFYGETTARECCFKAFLRGLFLSSGGCTVPDRKEDNKTGYHLELNFSHGATAESTAEKLSAFGLNFRITRRKDSFVLYLKSAEEIKDFIALLSAPVAVLKLTDLIIEKELTNNSNRQKNCDLANVGKQVEASIKQVEAIEKLEKNKLLYTLGEELVKTATARKNFPEDTLAELAQRLSVSKSCLNHRLRKIAETAQKINTEEENNV